MQTGPQGIEEFGEGVESGMVLRVAELVTAIHYLYAESQILGYSLRECAFIEWLWDEMPVPLQTGEYKFYWN